MNISLEIAWLVISFPFDVTTCSRFHRFFVIVTNNKFSYCSPEILTCSGSTIRSRVIKLASIEEIIGTLGNECLILIEADLSLLANLALDPKVTWLKTSSNFIIDEDEKQTELVSELFKQINATIPKRISSKTIEDIS